jgi:hypothetical protein
MLDGIRSHDVVGVAPRILSKCPVSGWDHRSLVLGAAEPGASFAVASAVHRIASQDGMPLRSSFTVTRREALFRIAGNVTERKAIDAPRVDYLDCFG